MMRALRRHSTAIQTIAVVGICAVVLATAVFSKPRAGHWCPCGVGAAFVAATGSTITAFTLAQVTELYLVLWQGFAAIHSQINASTNANQETESYQSQVYAQLQRQEAMYRRTVDSQRPATIGFQTSASSAAAGAELNTDLVRDAIHEENYQWRTNLDELTAGTAQANAALNVNARLEKYCNQRDAALGICDLPSEPRHTDADKDASTLYAMETLDEAMIQPAIDRCRLLSGLPAEVPSSAAYTSPGGAELRLARDNGNARAMLSFAMCDYLVATRTELPEDSLREWAEQVVQRITGGVGMPPPASSCRPFGGGGGGGGTAIMPYVPTDCAPFPDGFQYPGYGALASDQVNVMNLVYSELVSYGISHYAAMAVAMTTIEESNAGRTMREAWNSSCPAAIQGPTMCALPPISGARTDCTPAGNCGYVPTGLGLIQWSGWEEDGCWGRGCDLQRGPNNPNTGMPWQKCDLIAAADGGCAPSHEMAVKNNVDALMANLATDPDLYARLSQPYSDPQQAASDVTNQWIRPYAAARARRPGDMAQAINDQGLHNGACGPGGGMASGGTGGGTSPIVRTSAVGTSIGMNSGAIPGSPITASLQSPMLGSGLQQNDCFGHRRGHSQPNRFHPGVDLVSSDALVRAAGTGVVESVLDNCPQSSSSGQNTSSSGCGGGYGNTIVILHPDGSRTYYAHNAPNSAQVSPGQTVSAGQPIATMGNTGASFGTHLDFRVVSPSGYAVNPHAVMTGLPANNCGSSMNTEEYLACTAGISSGACTGATSSWVALDGSLQSPPGAVGYDGSGDYFAGGTAGGSCGQTADLGLNIDAEHISHLELMQLVSEYRFSDPGWFEFVMTGANRAQLIREYNAIHATKLYMNWQSYEQQVKMTGIISAWAASEAQRAFGVSQN